MHSLRLLFAGAILCNSLPHLVAGLQGRRFPTSFSRFGSSNTSAPWANFLWGFANLAIGLFMLARHPEYVESLSGMACVALGFLAIGIFLSTHFEKMTRTDRA